MEERQSRHMLEQVVTTLQQKVQSLERKDISNLCQKYLVDLERKFKNLELNYTLLKDENQKISQDFAILRQTQSVGSIGNLKQQVQATTNTVNQLENNSMVRNHDIIALSQITYQNRLDVTAIGQNLSQLFTSVEQELLKKTQNVAFTAGMKVGTLPLTVRVIRFNKVKISTGVSNLLAITSTGTFTVQVDGLHIIAVTVNSDTNDSAFEIYKNNIPLSRV
ncbi:unnamed protein product [Mytilus edulis]|uniref:C1q domain-containing protein n=1 Tax=Mytilus edulis TaxID=6550 RepID=A0A8S3RPV5_MYTED|nr:unnamed protein product [Mytilus edulis]